MRYEFYHNRLFKVNEFYPYGFYNYYAYFKEDYLYLIDVHCTNKIFRHPCDDQYRRHKELIEHFLGFKKMLIVDCTRLEVSEIPLETFLTSKISGHREWAKMMASQITKINLTEEEYLILRKSLIQYQAQFVSTPKRYPVAYATALFNLFSRGDLKFEDCFIRSILNICDVIYLEYKNNPITLNSVFGITAEEYREMIDLLKQRVGEE